MTIYIFMNEYIWWHLRLKFNFIHREKVGTIYSDVCLNCGYIGGKQNSARWTSKFCLIFTIFLRISLIYSSIMDSTAVVSYGCPFTECVEVAIVYIIAVGQALWWRKMDFFLQILDKMADFNTLHLHWHDGRATERSTAQRRYGKIP